MKAKTHYIAMNGLHGCLPDSCNVYISRKDARESLTSLLELSTRQARELSKYGIVECTAEQGAEYCEISECSCQSPWEHQDSDSQTVFELNNPEFYYPETIAEKLARIIGDNIPNMLNLDGIDADDLREFWSLTNSVRPIACARALFPEKPTGYVNATKALGHYASNKATAMTCRASGKIQEALMYEEIAERIYKRLPGFARW